ncbi:MAG: DUF2723 domain-containing protein [Saprospiraceae bacterium]
MMQYKTINNIAGWLTFLIAAGVLCASVERTGSLWDCGEFISGAYKLQVVHPPGAPVFLIVGRLFAWVADLLSDNPSDIAYAVNLLSALCTAFAALFICWSATILGRLALVGREGTLDLGQQIAVSAAGITAGLTTAFCTSVWFSAVEGEVYAMSTFFTCMTLWAALKWYNLPDDAQADRWLIFAFFSTALSVGVHLLSLLTFPALALLYYFKKLGKNRPTLLGAALAAGAGVLLISMIQMFIIAGIPRLWARFELFTVNSLGLPFHTGIIPVLLIFAGLIWFALRYARRTQNGLLQRFVVAIGLIIVAYLSYGTVVIRANANPPINMNEPSDAMRLLPYLNREQYGERPLLRGPNFDVRPIDIKSTPRYGRVGDRYRIVDEKVDPIYPANSSVLFPRMGDNSQGRPDLYRAWIEKESGPLTFGDNLKFFWRYQIKWMYWRYFMWNFAGRQNGEQGLYAWDPSAGNWISGIAPLDEMRLGNLSELPEFQRENPARNRYYLIPFLLGLIGMVFHYLRRPREFAAVMALFVITGLGIIVYSNQPPSEPRERDYVLVGSFFTFAIWVGMSALAIFEFLRQSIPGVAPAGLAALLSLSAPLLLVTENWDDHSRAEHTGSRDYARNFLESCEPNAIIFTYGDNDTYPLWYCQEVEGIRTDVRVVNLSLIAVDWYINQMRRAVNNAPAIKMSIPHEQIRGNKRIEVPYFVPGREEREMSLADVVKFVGGDNKPRVDGAEAIESYLPTRKVFIPVNKAEILRLGIVKPEDADKIVDTVRFKLAINEGRKSIIKDQLALMDIVASNLWERPIYWAVTCREDRLLGLDDFLQLEGLALRIVPIKTNNREDRANFGLIGMGRVADDLLLRNVTEKWTWGNFDKKRLHVDRAYGPSLQTMRLVMIRAGRQMVAEGKNEEAIKLADQYFEAFPFFNFPPDQFAALMADVYARAGAKDKATRVAREMIPHISQVIRFYDSQPARFKDGYRQDYRFATATAQTLMRVASQLKDEALAKELTVAMGSAIQGAMPSFEELPDDLK